MGWHLQLKTEQPLDLSAVDFDAMAGVGAGGAATLERLPLRSGRKTIPLAEAFTVSRLDSAAAEAENQEQPDLVLSGDLRNVVGVGTGLTSAVVKVTGNTGPLAGQRMAGGKLLIDGDAATGLGAGMTGGEIRLLRNALGDVAPFLPTEKYGMNRGEIYIHGNVAGGLGYRMRRGLIFVAGSCGGIVGENMLAGTIVIGGDPGPAVGSGMRRGTILLNQPNSLSILPTFGQARTTELVVCRLLRRHLQKQGAPIDLDWLDNGVGRFWGDPIYGSRGEILLPAECNNRLGSI